MKKKTMELLKISASIAVAAILALGSTAQADTFTGLGDGVCLGCAAQADTFTGLGDGVSWEDPANWLLNAVPVNGAGAPATNVFINGGHDVVFDSNTWTALIAAGNTQSATQYRAPRFLMNENTGAGAIGDNSISFDFGNANTILTGNSTEVFGSRSPGITTVNLDSGMLNLGKTTTFGARNGGTGILNLNGGEFFTGREDIRLGNGTGGIGIVNASGGQLRTRGGLEVRVGSSFNVIGTGSQIGIGSQGSVDGFWVQQVDGILSPGLDGTGVSTILIDDVGGGGGAATFDSGSILDPYDLGGWTTNVWETVLFAEGGITDNGLVLSSTSVAAGWESQIIGGNELQVRLVSAIPEPSSLALIGLGGVFFAARRRKLA